MDDIADLNIGGCFGEESKKYAETLKEYIRDELSDSQYYTILATKAPNNEAAKTMRRLAADELRHARRFSVALFLITGETFFPPIRELPPVIVPPYKQALRERYFAESKDAVKYPRFAEQVSDPCLKRLAIDTGKGEEEHARIILEMLEMM